MIYDFFRNGQLVGYAPHEEGPLTLDRQGKASRTFTVTLPRLEGLRQIEFTADAFNSDRVKSETARKLFDLPQPWTAKKGRAYLITIGVNDNQLKQYRLSYAANHARSLQSALAIRLLETKKYDEVVEIPLISDYRKGDTEATKANIKAVLDFLSGKSEQIPIDVLRKTPFASGLKKAQPEDLLLISFSGHGYADQNGIFYLVPYDIGKGTGDGLKGVLSHCISSDELSAWLRDVDAGEMMMIIDACYSATAIQGKEFKPGPMGSSGFGQLSYDKGMRIISASQADDIAVESDRLEHGLLTLLWCEMALSSAWPISIQQIAGY